MTASDLREHRIPCVRQELQRLIGRAFRLSPKDPDRYPDFYLHFLPDDADSVELRKASNGDNISIDLRKIAEITRTDDFVHIRVLGRVVWKEIAPSTMRWRFEPTGDVGRPPVVQA
jgi:hypothetical protein